jgi:hypothetical protein
MKQTSKLTYDIGSCVALTDQVKRAQLKTREDGDEITKETRLIIVISFIE